MNKIDRLNAMTAQRFEHQSVKNRDGSPLRARRNGKTKIWKTKPNDFKIPVKYGLSQHFYINDVNAHEWNVVQ